MSSCDVDSASRKWKVIGCAESQVGAPARLAGIQRSRVAISILIKKAPRETAANTQKLRTTTFFLDACRHNRLRPAVVIARVYTRGLRYGAVLVSPLMV